MRNNSSQCKPVIVDRGLKAKIQNEKRDFEWAQDLYNLKKYLDKACDKLVNISFKINNKKEYTVDLGDLDLEGIKKCFYETEHKLINIDSKIKVTPDII